MNNVSEFIKFARTKDFKFVKILGSGGTGDTILLLDETTEMEFAFKKFSPKQLEYKDEFYERFVDEIKILFRLFHPNIVRMFNYYLYPESKTGYIQMEYVNGSSIDEYREISHGKEWNQIFVDLVGAFNYLEQNKILHRDIRVKNILITSDGTAKVIDFGFGLILPVGKNAGSSVMLNWPVSQLPDELDVVNPQYTHQSEIYFLGKLLKSLNLKSCEDFRYMGIIEKMCKTNPDERFGSFSEIINNITKKNFRMIKFSDTEKVVYKKFADALLNIIAEHIDEFKPISDPELILDKLSNIVKISDLEENVQNYNSLLRCFVDNDVSFYPKREFETKKLVDFFDMMTEFDSEKKQNVVDSIILRLGNVKVESSNDLPF